MKIVIAGDACVDNYTYTYSDRNPRNKERFEKTWKYEKNIKQLSLPGGVDLIRHFISGPNIDVISPKYDKSNALQSYSNLNQFNGKDAAEKKYRISNFLGYSGNGDMKYDWSGCQLDDASLYIIDDAGNDFWLDSKNYQPLLDHITSKDIVIYKLAWPLFLNKNKLLYTLFDKELPNMVVIIDVNDLRDENIHIAQNLSWESTIVDIATKFNTIVKTKHHTFKPSHIILRVNYEATAYLTKKENGDEQTFEIENFFYLPNMGEGEFNINIEGDIQGNNAVFTAYLAKFLKDKNNFTEQLKNAIPEAMQRSMAFLEMGYVYEKGILTLPDLNEVSDKKNIIHDINIPPSSYLMQHGDTWTILEEETAYETTYNVAFNYVKTGVAAELDKVPVVNFGKLKLIDRGEIEKFRSIKKLLEEYHCNLNVNKPLSIGVFGPPGSGKSFGVKQVVKTILGKVQEFTFNLSQFETSDELIRAMHKVRDYSLRNECPLVFFDEFDSSFNGKELGWLKYFLAPMQDGVFRDGETEHPIGKAIFVFAGGTSPSFSRFSREIIDVADTENIKKAEIISDIKERFKNVKGPDFVSRLKGYIDIVGVNRLDEKENMFMIRRALMLRINLQAHKNLVDDKKELQIDPDIIRAMIMAPTYKHGSRSLSAIVEMSTLEEKRYFDKSALPTNIQLKLHTEDDMFNYILTMEETLSPFNIKVAKSIHKNYREKTKDIKEEVDRNWDDLSPEYQNSNLEQATDNFLKLVRISCKVEHNKHKIESIKFTENEKWILAEWEHKRWNSEKIEKGWSYGSERDEDNMLHPDLLPWNQLADETKNKDIKAVEVIVKTLNDNYLSVIRI